MFIALVHSYARGAPGQLPFIFISVLWFMLKKMWV